MSENLPVSNLSFPNSRRDVGGCSETDEKLRAISLWIDTAPCNADRAHDALAMLRVMKLAEEVGEVADALTRNLGGNPRKVERALSGEVVDELLDVAVTALAALAHFTPWHWSPTEMLAAHVDRVHARAGLTDQQTADNREAL